MYRPTPPRPLEPGDWQAPPPASITPTQPSHQVMPPRPRKRVRRRKVVDTFDDDSSSESSSSSEASSSASNPSIAAKSAANDSSHQSSSSIQKSSETDDSSSASTSSSSSASSGSSLNRPNAKRGRLAKKQNLQARLAQQSLNHHSSQSTPRSPSPIPDSPPAPLPISYFDPDLSLPYLDTPPDFNLPPEFQARPAANRQIERLQSSRQRIVEDEERFRNWYMAHIVHRFPNELDQLRSSSSTNLKTNRSVDLDVLIASLESGVDIFEDDDQDHCHLDPSLSLSSDTARFNDHQLVLETLDLSSKINPNPTTSPPPAPSVPQSAAGEEDVEMST